MAALAVELVCIGNELLSGRTVNTNARWLCARVYGMGGTVKRVTVVADDATEIEGAFREAASRRADWVIATGGLGPTYDDLTLSGLARALGVGLKEDGRALEMVSRRTARLDPARRKMAAIPEGTEPLFNPAGTAPGVAAKMGVTKLACLPGVPAEMMAIFDAEVAPRMSGGPVRSKTLDVEVLGVPEADMAPLLAELAAANPEIYVKSHPQGPGRVVVQFSGRGEEGVKAADGASGAFLARMREVDAKCSVRELR